MVTMSDIARAAGVSRLTVSAVLNDRRGAVRISDSTRERVIAVARQMNYRHNALASAVRKGRTNIIGILGCFEGNYGLEMINGLVDAAEETGFSCKFRFTGKRSGILENLISCLEYRACGIICRSGDAQVLTVLRNELEREGIPLVLLDSCASADWCSRVNSDDFAGGRNAAGFLLNHSGSRILYAAYCDSDGIPYAKWRKDGFESALGRPLRSSEMLVFQNRGDIDDQENSGIAARIRAFQPSAIFCDSDYIALKILAILGELRLSVPDDVSVMGFGGFDFSPLAAPPLTTVQQPFAEMGRNAVLELKRLLDGGAVRDVFLDTKLVIRKSAKKGVE